MRGTEEVCFIFRNYCVWPLIVEVDVVYCVYPEMMFVPVTLLDHLYDCRHKTLSWGNVQTEQSGKQLLSGCSVPYKAVTAKDNSSVLSMERSWMTEREHSLSGSCCHSQKRFHSSVSGRVSKLTVESGAQRNKNTCNTDTVLFNVHNMSESLFCKTTPVTSCASPARLSHILCFRECAWNMKAWFTRLDH